MCDGRIHRTQRFPANPANGQVPVWNALTKKWEAQNQSGGGSLPPGSNPNDMLFWDATNEEWIVGAEVSGFNPSSDYSISGQLDYSNGLILSATDPSSAFSPITGVSIFADTSDNFSVKRADGIRYSFSSAFLTTDRKFTFPDRDGKFAMSDFDNEFTATQTFTQINNGKAGFPGKINWYNDSGSLVAASGIVPGASNFFHEGNNFNFRSNSTGFFFGGGSSWVNPTARFHVRGDGTNPIFRFENNTGTASLQMTNSGSLTLSEGNLTIGNGGITAFGKISTNGGYNNISGTPVTSLDLNNTIANSAGSSNTRIASMQYTINNSGTQSGSVTGIFMNVTETNLNGVTSDFINFQRNGSTTLRIGSTGNLTASNTIQTVDINLTGGQQAIWNSSGRVLLTNSSFNGFDRLQFGGTTNLFPALKRNSSVLEVYLADNSDFAGLAARNIACSTFGIIGSGSISSLSPSAAFQIDNTTRGFLLPRMTTVQRDAIASPAEGLEIYNTTEKAKQYWNGIAWKTILTA